MKRLIMIILCGLGALGGVAQTTFKENVPVESQGQVAIDFPFTDEIVIKTWEKNEVFVQAEVSINDGEDDQIFAISKEVSSSSIRIYMDEKSWKSKGEKKNSWNSEIHIIVYLPKSVEANAKTISGDILVDYYGKPLNLHTISGDIDLTINDDEGLDFQAKTISGDVFSDLEIQFPNGKDGLRKIVGMDVKGRVQSGGEESNFQTISGNVYLRKG